ncbi:MAG: preprotein translocase subunit YajC [Phycisphaerales bacterium]|nr:preprotein translocase subunit YajC [Phycisphaerales bacterium]
MTQPNPSPAPATNQPAATLPAPPAANVTRSDNVIGGTAPAAATQPGAAGTLQPGGGQAVQPSQGGGSFMLVMALPLVALVLMMFLGQRGEKKKRAEHAATLASLQRNDKVQTIGGVIGTVAEIQDAEVVLKTDELTNSRIRVQKSAISAVLNRAGGKGEMAKATT